MGEPTVANDRDELIEKLLKENAELQRRLAEHATVSQSGPGAIATTGGIAAGEESVVVGGDLHGSAFIKSRVDHVTIVHGTDDERTRSARLRQRYLAQLSLQCRALPLEHMGGDADPQKGVVTLDQVYVALNTTLQVPDSVLTQIHSGTVTDWGRVKARFDPLTLEQSDEAEPLRYEKTEPTKDMSALPALDALRLTPHLVLLGDPGGGKTSFVGMVVARLADANPPPGVNAELLPVIVVLRDLALRLADVNPDALPPAKYDDALVEALRNQMVADLAGLECTGFTEGLTEALHAHRCLLVCDGLDEVPPALRGRVRRAVLACVARYALPRVIVTCRKRSYEGEAVLPGFEAFTLAPFTREQIETFAHAWYNAQRALGRVNATQAEDKARDLTRAALTTDHFELAVNPMLLTTMALIHQQERELPKERVRLYSKAVEVLLLRWQTRHTRRDLLAEFLRNDRRVREVMERLAYEAHDSKPDDQQEGTADLSRPKARDILEEYFPDDANQARAFLNYVDQRAGLLVGRGGQPGRPVTYSFPHRTFQEYLAGCHLLIGKESERVEQFYARAAEGDRWNLVAQLGAEQLFFNERDGERQVLYLADHLLNQHLASQQDRRAALWSGQMAELVGRKAIERDTRQRNGGAAYLQDLLPRLVQLLSSDLSAAERCQAGDTLARLGDPRFLDAKAFYLPDDRWISLPANRASVLGFVEIPAGSFVMGEDEGKHHVTLPTYYIGCYPEVRTHLLKGRVATSFHS